MTSFSRRDLVKGGAAMAGGVVLRARPARAATKVRLLTNWFAEAEHGGFYQAVAAGLYDKAGLDVEIRQGNAQLNGMQVLLGGEADIIMSYDITILNGVEKGAPVKAFFTSFQFDLIGLMTRPEINSLAELKGRKVYFGANGYSSYWPWLKQRFGFTDEMAAPKGPNLATFFNDTSSAVAGYLTAEPFLAVQRNVPVKFFLFAEQGYPPYANTMVTTTAYMKDNSDVVARFTRASVEGWKDYLRDPNAGNALIKKLNPQMPDEHIAFSLQKMRDVKAVEGGDAATMGIGIMTEERWQKTRDFLVQSNLLKADTDWKQAFTTDYIKDLKITM
ncbi:MAG: NitT/TauT family transport system substrate-binding protein [Alphaproteobacteria bacterium]|jgi:NitT/TauT family transport system substrate-binding protein|nr:NitT/TauT family transport system substrate-binding protein [Alphaproteobacteria bacterium]